MTPDLLLFPDFDDNIRKGFRKETELFFAHILRQNKSALELLTADYTFVDERLARHYGIPGVYGSRFRQVQLTDPNRRGLLGQGSVLSLTSVATRTSPVLRGKFILTTFLNTPPPPAAAERADARGERQGPGGAQDRAAADGAAPQQPDVRVVPPHHRPGGLRARELQLRSGSGATSAPTARRSTPRACWPTARRWTARPRCAR